MFNTLKNTTIIIFNAIDWGWNPTHTDSALRAVEGFLNAKKSYPRISAMLEQNPEAKKEFECAEFVDDMKKDWDLQNLKEVYTAGTLGYNYADFMSQLGFEHLHFNLQSHIPDTVQNIFKLGIKNHDLVHLLFCLYDKKDNRLEIRDYHEWIFLSWVLESAKKELVNIDVRIVFYLLFPSRIKATLTFRLSEYNQSQKLGKILAKTSQNLNQIWLKPYFNLPVDEARKALGVITLDEAIKQI